MEAVNGSPYRVTLHSIRSYAMPPNPEPTHPGLYIKNHILPKGLSVKAAAELLGVGRPALSNLLNGNAALSPDMAARLERAFGVKAQTLMDRQAAYDAAQAKASGAPATPQKYVPPFLSIPGH